MSGCSIASSRTWLGAVGMPRWVLELLSFRMQQVRRCGSLKQACQP
jgi:hypothetical protein